jgi:predicted ATPase
LSGAGFVVRHADFEYRFLHDRVQQAAYMLVPKELNRRVHLEVAQFLLAKAETQGADQTVVSLYLSSYAQRVTVICSSYRLQQCFDVFDVAYHFNKAAELITDPEQRLLVARLNLRAAVKARKSMGTPPSVVRACVCVCVCVCV